MRYEVRVKITVTPKTDHYEEVTTIVKLPFHWKRMTRIYKSFEPTTASKRYLDQFPGWENLDINTPTEQLAV